MQSIYGLRMQLRQLRHFLAAIDSGSMTQAARDQNVTQPSLSRSIRMLELALKVNLLERGRGGVFPTTYGAAFADHARSILNGVDHAAADVSAMKAGRLGKVRIGLSESGLSPRVARAVAALSLHRDDLRVSIDYDIQTIQSAKLRRNELDLVIGLDRRGLDDQDLSYRPVARLQLVVMVRRGHPLAQRRSVPRRELATMPWAIVEQTGADQYYRQILDASAPLDNIRIRCSAPTIHRLVALESDMLVMTSRFADEGDDGDGLVAVDTDLPTIEADLCLITRRRGHGTGVLRFAIAELTKSLAKPHRASVPRCEQR